MFGNLLILLIVGAGVVFLARFIAGQGRKYRSKFIETCPRCRTVNTFTPKPCQNCSSTATQFDYRGEPDIPLNTKCYQCQTVTPYFAECSGCRANLAWRFANKIKPSEALKNYMK